VWLRFKRGGLRRVAGVHARSSQPPDKVEILRNRSLSGPRNLRSSSSSSILLSSLELSDTHVYEP